MNPDPDAIDAILPQTQCTQCGFDGCRPYAEAIAGQQVPVNRCAPGGDEGIRRLADLTGLPYAPLDPAHGVHKPRVLAVIDEARCIGCTICIQKCPVDAIAGAAKRMHTVIADECTGCELCVAPCPVDCIDLVAMPQSHPAIVDRDGAANHARNRHRARAGRLARNAARAVTRRALNAPATGPMPVEPLPVGSLDVDVLHVPDSTPASTPMSRAAPSPPSGSEAHKREAIAAAIARARARRSGPAPSSDRPKVPT